MNTPAAGVDPRRWRWRLRRDEPPRARRHRPARRRPPNGL